MGIAEATKRFNELDCEWHALEDAVSEARKRLDALTGDRRTCESEAVTDADGDLIDAEYDLGLWADTYGEEYQELRDYIDECANTGAP